MDIQLLVGIAALLVGALGTYFQSQQVHIMKAQMSSSTEVETLPYSISKSYWTMAIMVMLVIAAWMPYFIDKQSNASYIPVIESWGFDPNQHEGPYRVFVRVDGARLLSYQSQYRLAVALFDLDLTKDISDLPLLQKSELFDIQRGSIIIVFYADRQFMRQVVEGKETPLYVLFLIPNGIRMEQFSTVREARTLGAIDVDSAASNLNCSRGSTEAFPSGTF